MSSTNAKRERMTRTFAKSVRHLHLIYFKFYLDIRPLPRYAMCEMENETLAARPKLEPLPELRPQDHVTVFPSTAATEK